MLSVVADGRKLTPFVILKRRTLPKEKLPTRIVFKCNEKGWMMERVIVEWLREVWQTGCCSKEKRNAGFRCFQGPLNRESENCGFVSTKYGSSDRTRRHGLSVYRCFMW
jgi:hypothetical protein